MNDRPLEICPKELCVKMKWGRGRVKKQLGSGAGLIFKGNGFYITDYRSEGYKQAAKKESESAKPAGGDAKASAGDSKPVAKTETKPAAPAAKK